jgi:hypothetical protein
MFATTAVCVHTLLHTTGHATGIRVFENCFFWHGLAWVAFTLTRARQFYWAN